MKNWAKWVWVVSLISMLTVGMGADKARGELTFTFLDGGDAPQSGDHNCSFVDMDNDGIDELYTNYWPKRCYKFMDGSWQDISSTTGALCSETRTGDHGLVFFDADNDGDYDFMDDDNYLYMNNGRGFFSDFSASAGLTSYLLRGKVEEGVFPQGVIFRTRGVSAGDIDGDGDNDVWVTGDGYHLGDYPAPRNYLFVNQLKETGAPSFIEDAANRGRDSYGDMSDNRVRPQYVRQGSMFFDYDDDGDLDLYITVNGSEGWHQGPYCCEAKNELWENDGTGHFTEVAELRGIEAPNSRGGTNVGDLDNDGYLDVVVDAARIYRYDPMNQVYVPEQVFDFPGFASCVGDFDHDGDLDIYAAGANVILENRIKENGWKNGFIARAVISGGSDSWRYLDARGCAMADFDNDGDLDIYWTHMAGKPWYGKTRGFLLRNDLPANHNWLKVKLRGPHGDAAAAGAKVRVYQGGHGGDPNYFVARRDAISVQGYMDNHSQVLHFGLAGGQTYDVVVTFLTGETWTLSHVTPGQLLFIDAAQNDNQPPAISIVASGNVASNSATITWLTDEPGDSQVEYGLSTGYGSMTALDPALVSNHAVSLSGLSANTTYHYRVRSKDAAGNLAVSEDFTFTTSNLGQGATYYISPSGSNSYDGLSPSSPWKTFGYAIPELDPGDTLLLMDGTYSVPGGTGLPAITCGSNANNGTEAQPITIKAENERKALLQSTGDYHQAFYMNGCSYWNVIGLRGQGADLPPDQGGKPYSVFTIYKSDHITLQRLLVAYPNRYGNSQAIQVSESSHSLVEECEAYYFHRHGISIYRSDHITVRRSYVNSRGYEDVEGYSSHAGAEGRGDEGLTLYQTTDSIVENCISEGNEFFGNSGQRNKYLGSMALNNLYGFVVGHHCCEELMEAKDNIYINNVAVGSKYHGFLTQSDVNIFVDHFTSMNSIDYYGLYANNKYSDNRSSNSAVTWMVYPSLAVQNSLFLNNNIHGIRVNEDHVEDYAYRKFEYLNSYGHGQNYGLGLNPLKLEDVMEGLSQTDPQMGSCMVFVPKSSPMKGAGKNGEDIGANILYRYKNGVLTSQALWDPSTGAFPCGAIVSGMNDAHGSSCFDVHQRLNVNANGCSLEMSSVPPESQPPVIANVVSQNITCNEATISWLTDEPADSQVEYGLSPGYGSISALDPSLSQNHWVTLSGLSGNTTYHYRVKSKDAAGNLAVSGDNLFTTPPANQSPVASNGAAKTTQGTPVNGTLSASDADGDALTYSIVINGGLGTAQIANPATGSFTYTPKAGVTGTDQFTFKANDGKADSNVATVTVTINAGSSSALAQLRLVKGSSTYPGEGWDNAIDGDTRGWDGTVSAKGNRPYAIFAFADGSTKTVSKVRLMSDTGVGFPGRWVAQFRVQVSTTNTSSSSFATVLNKVSKSGGAWQEYVMDPTPAKYIKLIVDEPRSSFWKQIGEFEVYVQE